MKPGDLIYVNGRFFWIWTTSPIGSGQLPIDLTGPSFGLLLVPPRPGHRALVFINGRLGWIPSYRLSSPVP